MATVANSAADRLDPAKIYDWPRFWCPPDGELLPVDGGFVLDPTKESWLHAQPDVVSFDQASGSPSLALLGEPGSGKSTALEKAVAWTQERRSSDEVVALDMYSVDSPAWLHKKVFEPGWFVDWKAGDYLLHLFLDSLDEAPLAVGTLVGLLAEGLSELNPEQLQRLKLRLACRTSDWSDSFDKELQKVLPEHRPLEILSLRRRDVESAARDDGLDTEALLGEIYRTNAVGWAERPLTLKMILGAFAAEAALPESRAELFRRGCLAFCEEQTERRRKARRTRLDAEERLAVAARIAGVLMFCGKEGVSKGPHSGDMPPNYVSVTELTCGPIQVGHGREVVVDEAAIFDALETGLFTSRGDPRLGFAHQSFSEFLAAHYLELMETSSEAKADLVCAAGLPQRRVVPELREVAGWLSANDPKLFETLVEADPEALIDSDLAGTKPEAREGLVAGVLERGARDELVDPLGHDFRGLDHPGLAAQLAPAIEAPGRAGTDAMVAMLIAGHCKLTSLEDQLAEVALDRDRPPRQRVIALRALGRFASDSTRERIKPLAIWELPEDEDDQIKGAALRACWPGQITPEELFAALSPRKRPSLYGAYSSFLHHGLVADLDQDAVKAGLEWVLDQPVQRHRTDAFESLADRLMVTAADHIEQPQILDLVAQIAARAIEHHEGLISRYGSNDQAERLADPNFRHALLARLIGPLLAGQINPIRIEMSRAPSLLTSSDLEWLAEQAAVASDPERGAWLDLFEQAFRPGQRAHQLEILELADRYPDARRRLSEYLDPVELGSERATELRERHSWTERGIRDDPDPKREGPTAHELALGCLAEFEGGDMEAFLVMQKLLPYDSKTDQGYTTKLEMCELPGWLESDPADRARMLDASERFLADGDPGPGWSEGPTWRALAAYRALTALLDQRPDVLEGMNSEVWRRWAFAIVHCPARFGGDSGTAAKLFEFAYPFAAEELRVAATEAIEVDNRTSGPAEVLDQLDSSWDPQIEACLLEKASQPDLSPDVLAASAKAFARHASAAGIALIRSRVETLAGEPSDRELAAELARGLAIGGGAAIWPQVWELLKADQEFGRAFAFRLGERLSDPVSGSLTSDQLGELFIWLEGEFPTAEDPDRDGRSTVTPRDQVGDWRNRVLTQLMNRPERQAQAALVRIEEACPHLEWIAHVRARQVETAARAGWRKLTVAELTKLVSTPGGRVVRSSDELLSLVLDALEAIEARLTGDGGAEHLWDDLRDGTWKPKREEALSNMLAQQLQLDLKGRAVTNREPQVTKLRGEPGTGTRVDLLVQAPAPGPARDGHDLSVHIEVKPNWSKELMSALPTQLAGKYLSVAGGRTHGIFLVGWYVCDRWADTRDARRAAGLNRDQVRTDLEEQAAGERPGLEIAVRLFDCCLPTQAEA